MRSWGRRVAAEFSLLCVLPGGANKVGMTHQGYFASQASTATCSRAGFVQLSLRWWRWTAFRWRAAPTRSEEHTSELQSLMRISYAVFCLKKKHKRLKMQSYINDIRYTQ